MEKHAATLQIEDLLRRLESDSAERAWTDFLDGYAPLILQVVRLFETDPDDVAGCFLYVCEQLCANRFRRLRRFRAPGPASFATWLRAVARRLCIDWYRREAGRPQVFDSVARLSELDREVFRLVHRDQTPRDEAFAGLNSHFPGLTRDQFLQSMERVDQSLTPRQRWLLANQRRNTEPLLAALDNSSDALDRLQDPAPSPEAITAHREQRGELARATMRLSEADRMILRLRFEQELTLTQIAKLSGLPDAQTADRRLKKILAELRNQFGKSKEASV